MIVQACLNGARPASFHPNLPLTPEAMATDARAAVMAGSGEIHLHPRGTDGRESLAAIDSTLPVVRHACPGTLIGVSTGDWIEGDPGRTRACIAAWTHLPDYASVNLSEPDAPAVMDLLAGRGVGIEAGLATLDDVERLAAHDLRDRVLRVLIEIATQDTAEALREADAILARLDAAGIHRPILLHGMDATVWPLVGLAGQRRCSTRIGLEDGLLLPDGAPAKDNADLVRAAVQRLRAEGLSQSA